MGLCASEYVNPNKVDLSHFQIMTTVGAGGFGKVRLAVDLKERGTKDGKQNVALKFLEVSYYHKPHRRAQLLRERKALASINSPFVVKLLHAFTTSYEIVFVMPFLNGGDFCVYLSRKSLTEKQVKFATAEVILGMEAIHAEGYVYRDLKPENILLDRDGHCVITDLGLVAKVSAFDKKYQEPFEKHWPPPHHLRLRGVSGTPGYMAPEVFVKSYDMLADFFSLGAFIYSLFTNKIPFPSQSRKYFFKTSFHLPESITRLPVGAAELVQGLCAYYERDRLGYDGYWNDVRKHSYFKDYPWDDIAAKSRLSPFRITEEYNFNMRYNLEDTFAFNYEGEKIKLEDAKKIFQMLKGIQYNLDPPFKLSDGTTYLTGSSGAKKVPKPKKKMAPKTPPPDRKDPSKENLRKSKITHLSNLSASSPKMKTEGKSTTDSMGILTPRSVGTHKSALRSSRRSGSNPFTTSPLIKEDKPGIQEIIPEAKT